MTAQQSTEMGIAIVAGLMATAIAGLNKGGQNVELSLELKQFDDGTIMRLHGSWEQNNERHHMFSKQINIAHPMAGQAFANEFTDTCREIIEKQDQLRTVFYLPKKGNPEN